MRLSLADLAPHASSDGVFGKDSYSPVDPAAFDGYVTTAFAYFSKGEYETALAWADKALRERPRWAAAHWGSIAAAAMAGRPREHLSRAVEDLRQLEPSTSVRSVLCRFSITERTTRDTIEAALRKAGLPE